MQNKLQLVDYVKSLLTLKNPAHLCKCKTNPYVSNAYLHITHVYVHIDWKVNGINDKD